MSVALGQLSGEPGASVAQTGITAINQFVGAIFDTFVSETDAGTPFSAASAYAPQKKVSREAQDAYAAMTPRDALAPVSRWSVWASGYGGSQRIDGDAAAGSNTTTSNLFGTAAGAAYRMNADTLLGFALGGAGSNFNLANGLGGGRADIFNAAVYARHTYGPAYVAGVLAYSWQGTTTDRTVTVAGVDQLHAAFHANALAGRVEAGYRYVMPAVAVAPYAALQSTTFFLPSYGETATSGSNQFALSYGSQDVTATRGELGARFDKPVAVANGTLSLKAKLAWAHDWNTDRAATATFQQLPGATFTVNGAEPSADAALVSLGGEMAWGRGWTVAANFDGEFSASGQTYAGKGAIKYAW